MHVLLFFTTFFIFHIFSMIHFLGLGVMNNIVKKIMKKNNQEFLYHKHGPWLISLMRSCQYLCLGQGLLGWKKNECRLRYAYIFAWIQVAKNRMCMMCPAWSEIKTCWLGRRKCLQKKQKTMDVNNYPARGMQKKTYMQK